MKTLGMMGWALLAVLVSSDLHGQTESKTLDRIAREQQNIRYRLDRILEKMERLVKRNELDGRQHTADLIRRAKAEIEKRDLMKRIEDLDAKIRASQLTVEGEQSALLKDLEDIFAILQDRTDMERLEDMINAYAEGLQKIGRFIDEQERILEETRRLAYEEGTLRASVREQVKELQRAQEALNAEVDRSAKNTGMEEVWSAAEELEALAGAEESLAEESARRAETGEAEPAEDLAGEQEKLGKQLENLRKRLDDLAEGRSTSGAETSLEPEMRDAIGKSEALAEQAQEEMRAASKALMEGQPSKAAQRQEKAAEALRDASERINRAGQAAYREERLEQQALGERQDALRREMEEVREKLERLQNMASEPSGGTSESMEQGEEILGEMEAARDRLSQGNPDSARPHQEKAKKGLEELDRLLEQEQEKTARKNAGGEGDAQPSPQAKSQQYQDLAERERALEERVRDLMRRMRELPNQSPVKSMSDAADNMAGAADELSAEQGEAAERDEDEARKHLEKAKQAMEQEEAKYQNIRQQEILFRVQEALEKLKAEQEKINLDTAELDLGRDEGGRVTRLERRTLSKLAEREMEVREKTADVQQKIEEDASTVFSWILERNADDLDEVIEYLRDRESGPVVQLIQADVSERFGELIDALKLEMQRRMEEANAESGEQQPPDASPPQRNPLIPPVAELIMIKKMEEGALRRLEEFIRINPDVLKEGAGPMEARMLERLGHRHASITELFEKMLERAAGQPGAPGEGQ